MSPPLVLVLAAGLAGACAVAVLVTRAEIARWVAAAAGSAVAAAALGAFVRSARGEAVAARGFVGDSWRWILVLGAVLPLVALWWEREAEADGGLGAPTLAGGDRGAGGGGLEGVEILALAASAAAAVGSVLAAGTVGAGLLLPCSSAAFALLAFAARDAGGEERREPDAARGAGAGPVGAEIESGSAESRPAGRGSAAGRAGVGIAAMVGRRRALAGFLASDCLAIAGLALASEGGMATPPRPGAAAGALLLAAAALRLGFPPLAWAVEDALGSHVGRAVALGAMRAQGLLLLAWSLRAGSPIPEVAAVVGAVAAAWGARRLVWEGSIGSAALVHAGLIATGLALGTPDSVSGAGLLAAIGFVVWPVAAARAAAVDAAMPTIGLWAAGAALPAVAVVVSGALRHARGSAAALSVGVLAGAAAAAAVAAAPLLAASRGHRSEGGRLDPALVAIAGALAAAALLPVRALEAIGAPAAAALGVARGLKASAPPFTDLLGVILVATAAAAFAWWSAASRAEGQPAPEQVPPLASRDLRPTAPVARASPGPAAWWAAASPVVPDGGPGERILASWARIATALGLVAVAVSVWLYAIGLRRGFL